MTAAILKDRTAYQFFRDGRGADMVSLSTLSDTGEATRMCMVVGDSDLVGLAASAGQALVVLGEESDEFIALSGCGPQDGDATSCDESVPGPPG